MPSLSSSPWILVAPHSEFSKLILRISSHLERGIVTAANVVDHVAPHRGDWTDFITGGTTRRNGRSSCAAIAVMLASMAFRPILTTHSTVHANQGSMRRWPARDCCPVGRFRHLKVVHARDVSCVVPDAHAEGKTFAQDSDA